MQEFREKYINPFTDYGFKRIFREEPNKNLLLDFLNELLKDKEGEKKKALKIAENLLKAEVSFDIIEKSTGSSEAEIKKLQ